MWYSTKIIQLAGAGKARQHYMVIEKQTICGIKLLQDAQTVLKYTLDETKLCEKCKEINPIPRVKDWCPRYIIDNGDQAKTALTILYLFYQALPEKKDLKIGWGIHEYFYTGKNNLTNFLVNPDPKIEAIIEEERALKVNIVGGDGRVKSKISFDLIAEYMPLIKEDFLMENLQENTN